MKNIKDMKNLKKPKNLKNMKNKTQVYSDQLWFVSV